MKDYYRVLNVSKTAGVEDIKRAFRSLALKYHPDKNPDAGAATLFAEVHEAYAVLKDPAKRAAYHYQLYLSSPGHTRKPLAHSAEEILLAARKLKEKMLHADPFRIDLDLLLFEVKDLLSDRHMSILKQENDPLRNRQLINYLTEILPLLSFPLLNMIQDRLYLLAETDALSRTRVSDLFRNAKRQYLWNRYKIIVALLLTLLFCAALLLSRKS